MSDDDMTPEEFDELWERAKPVDAIVRLNRPRSYASRTFCSAQTYAFTWNARTAKFERTRP